jgi:hypothetical protein
MRFLISALVVLAMGAMFYPESLSLEASQDGKKPGNPIMKTAQEFLATLTDKQKAQAVVAYDSDTRVKWHFIPMDTRKGLPLMEMEPAQKEAAMKLLTTLVSKPGYEKATKIMGLENVLRKLEGPTSHARRNPEKYYFTVFGEPGPQSHWGISVEGHHLSLNFVLQGNKIVDSTPQFFATNPAELKEDYLPGYEKGLRVLREEEQTGFDLLASLDADQKKLATLPGDLPQEIRGAGEPQPPTGEAVGLSAAKMKPEQQEKLKALMTAYTAKMRPLVAKGRWDLIEKAGFDKVTFAWSGADRLGVGHYYRVQGPTFVIEFINVQADAAGNPANHIHCVWRDMEGDFDLPIAAK